MSYGRRHSNRRSMHNWVQKHQAEQSLQIHYLRSWRELEGKVSSSLVRSWLTNLEPVILLMSNSLRLFPRTRLDMPSSIMNSIPRTLLLVTCKDLYCSYGHLTRSLSNSRWHTLPAKNPWKRSLMASKERFKPMVLMIWTVTTFSSWFNDILSEYKI